MHHAGNMCVQLHANSAISASGIAFVIITSQRNNSIFILISFIGVSVFLQAFFASYRPREWTHFWTTWLRRHYTVVLGTTLQKVFELYVNFVCWEKKS